MKHSSLFPPCIKLWALDSLLNPDEATVDRAIIHTANRAMLGQRYEEFPDIHIATARPQVQKWTNPCTNICTTLKIHSNL